MRVSHIVTNGCSFTYCQGLKNPSIEGWPAQLANKLKTEVVNLGLPGVGNDCIHRRTYEYVYKNLAISKQTNCVPLFIIAWSQPWRKEAWFENQAHGRKNFKDYSPIPLVHKYTQSSYEKSIVENWNEEDHCRSSLIFKLSLKNLFENNGIPFIMTNYMTQYENDEVENYIRNKFPELVEGTTIKNNVTDLCEITRYLPKLECGHDGIEAQNVAATFLENKIHEIYPEIVYERNQSFLKLGDFIKGHAYPTKFPEWIKFQIKSDIIT